MKSTVISDRIGCVRKGEPCDSQTLRIVPLGGEPASEPAYRLLDEQTLGSVAITEISEEGSVPELKVVNRLDVHLLLLAGQELVGAKQNRVLNADVLLPPASETRIPVSCVEQGRWRPISVQFGRGKVSPSSLRGGKAMDVARSLRRTGRATADQGKVWNDVAEMMDSLGVTSDTSAMNDAFAQQQETLDSIRSRLRLPESCLGIVVYDGEQFLGLDLFDRASTMGYFWDSLVESYAIDWLVRRRREVSIEAPQSCDVDGLLHDLAGAEWTEHASPGVGEDYRLEHESLTGSALVWESRSVVHMQAFPVRRGRGEEPYRPSPGRIRRPYR